MKIKLHSLFATCLITLLNFAEPPLSNPGVDYEGFMKDAKAAQKQRVERQVNQVNFWKMAQEKNTILLDARSADKFVMRHIKGARNLPFTDFSEASLSAMFPDKNIRILIYCNNNFLGDPISMFSKSIPAALNISTLISLHTYGYTNVYELAGLLNVDETIIPFEGELVKAGAEQKKR